MVGASAYLVYCECLEVYRIGLLAGKVVAVKLELVGGAHVQLFYEVVCHFAPCVVLPGD